MKKFIFLSLLFPLLIIGQESYKITKENFFKGYTKLKHLKTAEENKDYITDRLGFYIIDNLDSITLKKLSIKNDSLTVKINFIIPKGAIGLTNVKIDGFSNSSINESKKIKKLLQILNFKPFVKKFNFNTSIALNLKLKFAKPKKSYLKNQFIYLPTKYFFGDRFTYYGKKNNSKKEFENIKEFYQYLNKEITKRIKRKFNTNLGTKLGLSGIQKIYLQFKITNRGNIKDIKVRAPHPKIQQEIERISQGFQCNCNMPSYYGYYPVNLLFTKPITFRVD